MTPESARMTEPSTVNGTLNVQLTLDSLRHCIRLVLSEIIILKRRKEDITVLNEQEKGSGLKDSSIIC